MTKSFKLVTVDVWDTILRRKCHPEAIKYMTARQTFFLYRQHLIDDTATVESIYFERLASERSVASLSRKNGLDDEYSIESVFVKQLEQITNLSMSSVKSAAKLLVRNEIKSELKHSYLDKGIEDFLKEIDYESLVFLSDFYMSAEDLGTLIQYQQPKFNFHTGLSSSDFGYNKRSSNLYPKVQQKLKVSPKEWLHVGDNLHSDVEMAKKHGVTAKLYFNEEEERKKESNSLAFEEKSHGLNRISGIENSQKSDSDLTDIGVSISPIFAGFSEFIADKASFLNIDTLAFITREGITLDRIFTTYADQAGHVNQSQFDRKVWKLSRYSLLRSRPFNFDRYLKIWSQYGLRGVKNFLLNLEITLEDAEELLTKYALLPDEIILRPAGDERVKRLFADEKFIALEGAGADERFQNLKSYLFGNKAHPPKTVLLVDVGWLGSCQDILQEYFPSINFYGAYLGLRSAKKVTDSVKHSYLFNDAWELGQSHQLSRFSEVLETILASNSPTVVGYRSVAGKIEPIEDPKHEKDEFNSGLLELQRGIINGTELIGREISTTRLDQFDLRDAGLKQFNYYFKTPPKKLADLYFDASRHDIFREAEYSRRDDYPSIYELFKATIHRQTREKVLFFFRSTQWKEGFASSSGTAKMGNVKKLVFKLLFAVAQYIKGFAK